MKVLLLVGKNLENTMVLETSFSELVVTKLISRISNFDEGNPMKPEFFANFSKFMTSKIMDFKSLVTWENFENQNP